MIEINSDTLIPTDKPFKVFAGPGAGKTYWLIGHIKNVLQNSKRIKPTTKIACITYTNIAVEEIQSRLQDSSERVYVSTIHNFLYKYIVKPYGFLLKDSSDENLINLKLLDGHDEHIPNNKIVFDWKAANRLYYIKDDKKIHECLLDLDWQLNEDLTISLRPRHNWKRQIGHYWIKEEFFPSYKQYYWNRGTIHHEDVLCISYEIITKFPEILDYVSLKFPFLFLDEFQDTNPIQTIIIKLIAEKGTVVGVIGDIEQSIYKFQGAQRQDFINFTLNEISEYQIKGNRRSTNSIVKILNKLRTDGLTQTPIRNVVGSVPTVWIGEKMKTIGKITSTTPQISMLTRNNETVGQIKNHNNKSVGNLWVISRSLDSTYERQRLLYHSIYASELCLLGYYREAVREATRVFYKRQDGVKLSKSEKRKLAIMLIDRLIAQKETNKTLSIKEFYNELFVYLKDNHNVKIGSRITGGKYKKFSEETVYSDLVQALRIKDDTSHIKTIHKAKGVEYENVLIVMENSELKYLITPKDYQEDDESRIYYVGCSRAKDNLYISIPEKPSQEDEKKLFKIGFEIKN